MTKRRSELPAASRITPEAVAVFRRKCELWPIRSACISDDVCRSTKPNQHRAECLESIELSHRLFALLQLDPWHYVHHDYEAPAKLSKAKAETWWTEALEEAVADALRNG